MSRTREIAVWITFFVLTMVLYLGVLNVVYGMTPEESQALYEKRTAKAIAQNEAIINRKHEIEKVAKEIEVTARLQELAAPTTEIYVENNTSVESTNKNVQRVEVS